MSAKRDGKGEGTTVIIRKEEVVEGGHHGGAWKVAYADFVTAMMAFFLLMWLLNATSEEQKRGIADYFSPFNPIASGQSGNGQPFGGKTPFEDGSMVSNKGSIQVVEKSPTSRTVDDDSDTPAEPQAGAGAGTRDGAADRDQTASGAAEAGQTQPGQSPKGQKQAGASASGTSQAGEAPNGEMKSGAVTAGFNRSGTAAAGAMQMGTATAGTFQPGAAAIAAAAQQAAAQQEQAAFKSAADQIREAVRNDPALASLGRQLAIDETPEGLRIQLLDEDKQAMFAFGSSAPNDRARLLLQKVAPVLAHLSEDVSITGHTDAAPFKRADRSNWELSTERANATRRVLVDAGLGDDRFHSVSGDADRDPLLPGDPLAAANRRIAIVVLRTTRAPGNDAMLPLPAAPASSAAQGSLPSAAPTPQKTL